KQLLGGKGAGLAEMTRIWLPVPAGFTITTITCAEYYRHGKRWPAALEKQILDGMKKLERTCGRRFGDAKDPLLVSVRSGAAASMPGMMETILNLGLTDESVEGLAKQTGNRRFALDAYRRLIAMFGATAMGIERGRFDRAFDEVKQTSTRPRLGLPENKRVSDTDVNESELASVVERFKAIFADSTGGPFPQTPREQLYGAINAVFESWMAEKAVTYRRVEKITGLDGTAVNVCQMVFGNLGTDSGTGVCFTRDPSTGDNDLYGDVLINAQGEDVVAGVRTPIPVGELSRLMPATWDQLLAVRTILELHYRDMQDLEFTVERGVLYMLQCRTGKRSAAAAFKIAVDQATEPLLSDGQIRNLVRKKWLPRHVATAARKPIISKRDAIRRITERDVERLFCNIIDPMVSPAELARRHIGEGIGAVPGAASGHIAFDPREAERRAQASESAILVRRETSPEDVGGMHAAQGILTATGGKTSHAAVVARGWGKCCIVGCEMLHIDDRHRTLSVNGKVYYEGDHITLDGSTGRIYDGQLPLSKPQPTGAYETLLGWCDGFRRLRVRTNADTPADAVKAIELGAEGIGLCRTEHMFFETEARRLAMQEMIVADSSSARRAALDKLQPFQKEDFLGIFRAMAGKPVTIRLIDPPLHEFLPKKDEDVDRLAAHTGLSAEHIRRRTEQLHESNPMLGHRGCRLCMTYPEILEMQVSAIIEAAVDATNEGVTVLPEIMIPLTIDDVELRILTEQTRAVADAILDEAGVDLEYLVGTMVETPRAAILGERIGRVAQFISFGTNDLTQTTMGLSRDDAGRFLPAYVDAARYGVFPDDPFQSIDLDGVGMLVEWAVNGARRTNPRYKIGVCGEHGGDVASIKFFDRVGLDYVSCSPYRVPVARLAAAQAQIEADAHGTAGRQRAAPAIGKRAGRRGPADSASGKRAAPTEKRASKSRASKKSVSRGKKSTSIRKPKTVTPIGKKRLASKPAAKPRPRKSKKR
ncbi:MAG: pyruvate, phosphate dikinase, partial [Phycisphaerales bacterium]|nr:pyruvate, phosphate dikinase [Phycisphaerales bacterium]